MLITEKIKQTSFSPTEHQLVDYILAQRQELKHKTTKQISAETFTNPSMLVRIAKKLGFDGWSELKEVFLEEVRYLDSNFDRIDPNLPFSKDDGCMAIAGKLAQLHQTTISDTLSLIQYDALLNAARLLNQAGHVKVFTLNENRLIVQDFVLRMNRIHKYTSVCMTDTEHIYEAFSCPPDSCAIIVSYTGESSWVRQIIRILKKRGIPVIGMTGFGQSTLTDEADCVLHLTTRERLYSKIASFTITVSINYLLDVLYSCVFADQYDENLKRKIQISKLTDHRKSTSRIMDEN